MNGLFQSKTEYDIDLQQSFTTDNSKCCFWAWSRRLDDIDGTLKIVIVVA